MTKRIRLLLAALGALGAIFTCGQLLALFLGHRGLSDVLAPLAAMAYLAFAVGMIVQKDCTKAASRESAPAPVRAVYKEWLPEAVDVNISVDLVPELEASQDEILAACSAIRARHAVEGPIVRIRDDSLLKDKTYLIAINGLRVFVGTMSSGDDFKAKLSDALEETFQRYAGAIQFFVDMRAQAASVAPQGV